MPRVENKFEITVPPFPSLFRSHEPARMATTNPLFEKLTQAVFTDRADSDDR
jgi:hypothetical protein